MDLDGNIDTSQAESGSGGGFGRAAAFGGGGLGIGGLIIYLLVNLLGGRSGGAGGFSTNFDNVPAGGTQQVEPLSCPAGSAQTDVRCRMVLIVNDVQRVWAAKFAAAGKAYTPTKIHFFSGAVTTGCGDATSSTGPFYCPADQLVYLDVTFFDELKTRFGAPGEFAQAYVVAHEFGHHVQDLLGIEAQLTTADQRDPNGANALSVRNELQADCFAGVWSHDTNTETPPPGAADVHGIDAADIQQALDAASAIGDDRLQQQAGGTVNPDTFTHGTSAQRVKWFSTGAISGSIEACDTFSGTP
jgi:predicted metalloprotease